MGSWRLTRRLPWEIPSYPGWVAFSPDRKIVALELSPAVIHLVDAATGRTMAKLEDPRSDRAQWLGFTPDGARLVAISAYSRAIHIWDLRAIRQQLAAMDLDWKSPPYPPAPGPDSQRPLAVESLLGELSSAEHAADDRARRDIEKYRRAVLRDPSRALALAEKATRLKPDDPLIRNTLGVAYYRVGRYREAADALRANLASQKEKILASDLYFLAMSHHQLGELSLARAYYTWAERASRSPDELTLEELQERAAFQAEAELLMGK
jgi:tetratricopeptide (TPR) repeat protein